MNNALIVLSHYVPSTIHTQITPYMSHRSQNIITWLNFDNQYDGNPAVIKYNKHGELYESACYSNGQEHNTTSPTIYKKGTHTILAWRRNNQCHRTSSPAVITYNVSNKIIEEMWMHHGNLHRDNDEPAHIRYYDSPTTPLQKQCWYTHQKHNRETGPASIEYYPNGQISYEKWKINNIKHRHDYPAITRYTDNGTIIETHWIQNGIYGRINGPSSIKYFPNGSPKQEIWRLDCCRHRDHDQPATTTYYPTGQIERQEWYVNDRWHRDHDQPAIIEYNIDGSVRMRKWYVDDKLIKLV